MRHDPISELLLDTGSSEEDSKVYVNLPALRWAQSRRHVKKYRRALLLELARQADKYGASFSSTKTLATEIGVSDRTIRRCLDDLEELGIVRRIGRVGLHGGQISNVFIVIGWPDRTRIPRTGHPKLGPAVQESGTDLLNQLARHWTDCQYPPDRMSGQNKNKEENTTTVAENGALLATCFAALGRWATEQNRSLLTADIATLEKCIADGTDLQVQIVPTLRAISQREKIPVLRSWTYFADMFAAGRRSAPKKESFVANPAPDEPSHDRTPGQDSTDALTNAKARDRADPEMSAFLKKSLKRMSRGTS